MLSEENELDLEWSNCRLFSIYSTFPFALPIKTFLFIINLIKHVKLAQKTVREIDLTWNNQIVGYFQIMHGGDDVKSPLNISNLFDFSRCLLFECDWILSLIKICFIFNSLHVGMIFYITPPGPRKRMQHAPALRMGDVFYGYIHLTKTWCNSFIQLL